MKILLITHGRSGSTSLQNVLQDMFGLDLIIEPFNVELWKNQWKKEPPYKGGEIPDNVILKMITKQDDKWIINNASKFDKVIVLAREDMRESAISGHNAKKYGYLNKYEATEPVPAFSYYLTAERYCRLFELCDRLERNLTEYDMVWYNELFNDYDESMKIIRSLGRSLGKNISEDMFSMIWDKWLSPDNRLRIK